MKKSLQKIQDFYEKDGYKGSKLRNILLKDKNFNSLVKERKIKLTKDFPLTKDELSKYVMSVDRDFEILKKVKQLEGLKLNQQERFITKFIRTQLEYDWRKWVIKELNKILKKYKIKS